MGPNARQGRRQSSVRANRNDKTQRTHKGVPCASTRKRGAKLGQIWSACLPRNTCNTRSSCGACGVGGGGALCPTSVAAAASSSCRAHNCSLVGQQQHHPKALCHCKANPTHACAKLVVPAPKAAAPDMAGRSTQAPHMHEFGTVCARMDSQTQKVASNAQPDA